MFSLVTTLAACQRSWLQMLNELSNCSRISCQTHLENHYHVDVQCLTVCYLSLVISTTIRRFILVFYDEDSGTNRGTNKYRWSKGLLLVTVFDDFPIFCATVSHLIVSGTPSFSKCLDLLSLLPRFTFVNLLCFRKPSFSWSKVVGILSEIRDGSPRSGTRLLQRRTRPISQSSVLAVTLFF